MSLLRGRQVLVGPSVQHVLLVASVRAKLVDEAARRLQPNGVQIDAAPQFDEAGSDVPVLLEDRPRVTGSRRKELGDDEPLLGLEVFGEAVVELVPELRDAFAIVGLEGVEEPGEEVLELGVVVEEAVADGAEASSRWRAWWSRECLATSMPSARRPIRGCSQYHERTLREGAGSAGSTLIPVTTPPRSARRGRRGPSTGRD